MELMASSTFSMDCATSVRVRVVSASSTSAIFSMCRCTVTRRLSFSERLSEAMAKHPKIFKALYVSLISAGEETGKMSQSYQQLIKYLKWVDAMQARIRKATRYPMILLVVVLGAVSLMMGMVVPQIVDFIRNMEMELPFATTSLIATSDFFVEWWWAVLLVPVVTFATIMVLRKSSENLAYQIDKALIAAPVMGPLIRKINIARFCQTFGAL
ncbi:MAG: hypothetical protein DI595_22445, partial [Agrobacterium fabrum]